MPTARALVATDHASRYLQQLCKHWSHKFAVEFTPEAGTIRMPAARTSLRAENAALHVAIEAGEVADLERMETVVAEHIQRFAFREELSFDWHRES